MIQTIQLTPGVVLRHYPDNRFKTAVLSVQFQRPMCREEAALNALLSSVLLRGTAKHPDMRTITARLDGLYGATISPLMRRIGDRQTIGLFLNCLEDRFALPGDEILSPVIDLVKEILLERGYDVLMLRENENTQLDNIARTVFANQNADCHLALHYDSTDFDKGAFFMSVPDTASYRAMEPVASCWEKHEQLGECVVQGLSLAGIGVFEGGSMPMDLTQTSYSTIPSIDLEAGDRASDTSYEAQRAIAAGIADGIDLFWQETR